MLRQGQRAEAFLRRQLAYVQMRGSAAAVAPQLCDGYLWRWHGVRSTVRMEVILHAVDIGRVTFEPARNTGQIRIVPMSNTFPPKVLLHWLPSSSSCPERSAPGGMLTLQ